MKSFSRTEITDVAARQILARAAQIDAEMTLPTGLADLRQAALEAGIHPTAFDAALREHATTVPAPRPSIGKRIRQNFLAAGAFWVSLEVIVQPVIWLDLPASMRSFGMIIAMCAGIQIADRLRARLVRTALIAICAGQAVLFAFEQSGITTAGSNVLTWAVLYTGILATVAAAVYGWKDRRGQLSSGTPRVETTEVVASDHGDSHLLPRSIAVMTLLLGLTLPAAAQAPGYEHQPEDCSAVPERLYLLGPRHPGIPDSVIADSPPQLRNDIEPLFPARYSVSTDHIRIRFQLVIDSSGRAIPCSIKAMEAADIAFAQAGRETLIAARFIPARQGGRRVPMRVQQAINWNFSTRAREP